MPADSSRKENSALSLSFQWADMKKAQNQDSLQQGHHQKSHEDKGAYA